MKRRNQAKTIKLSALDPDTKWIDDFDIINGFHISKSTLDKWHREGLPKYKWGHKTYFKQTELNECLEQHKIIHPRQISKQNNHQLKKRNRYDTDEQQ